jgi:GNAT superfamily N-acetyltransferase
MPAAIAPAVRVVTVGDADLHTVAGLVNRAFGIYAHLFTGTRTSPEDYAAEAGPGARVLLIERDGVLAATALVAIADRFLSPELQGPVGTSRRERSSAEAAADEGHPWLGAFYFGLAGVEPALMRSGLGRTLVAHCEAMAHDEGFDRVALSTVREFGLVEYYSRFGYEIVSEVEHPAGHWEFLAPHHYCQMVKRL